MDAWHALPRGAQRALKGTIQSAEIAGNVLKGVFRARAQATARPALKDIPSKVKPVFTWVEEFLESALADKLLSALQDAAVVLSTKKAKFTA